MAVALADQELPQLDPVYAVVFLDAIIVKVRDNHVVANKPAYLAVGIDTDGDKHVLGIWLAKTDPALAENVIRAGGGVGGRYGPGRATMAEQVGVGHGEAVATS